MVDEQVKIDHLKLLHDHYSPDRFRGCDLKKERIKFLTELQGMMDGT